MFQYGNYIFTHNPQSYNKSLEFVGDKIITESGRLIIQPTNYKESLSLSSIFYQPMHKLNEINYIVSNSQCIGYDIAGKNFYIGTSNGKIEKYNKNIVFLAEYTPNLVEPNIVGVIVIASFLCILCQSLTSDTHYIYITSLTGGVYSYYTYNNSGIATGLAYPDVGNYLYKQRKDGYIEKIYFNDGDIITTYDCLRNYATDNFSGACFYKGYYLTVYNNQTIYVADLTLNKVIDILLIGRTGDTDVLPGVSILDLIYGPNFFGAIEAGKDKVLRLHLNTVSIDIYSLEKEIKKGKLTLTDNNNVDYTVNVNDYNKTKLEKYFNAYEISLGVNVIA